MRPNVIPGAILPDYELSDHTAKRRELSELQGQHPMVLVLSRGGYCPKDRRQAEGLVLLHREMEVGYSRLVTISTDNITETNEYRSGVGAHWPFLSDPGRIVQKDLDIAEYTDQVHNPMIPHVIVLEPGLVIYKIYKAIGSSAGRLWKSSARTCAPLLENAGQTGTSPRPNSERHGTKAVRNSSTLTAKHTPRPSGNRIRTGLPNPRAGRRFGLIGRNAIFGTL